MPTTPLFGLSGNSIVGLNGLSQALALQQQQLALEAAVRNNARDSLTFQSELDLLGQFADNAQNGLSASANLFNTAQNSLNPLTAQAGLNNFTNRASQLAPFAIEGAQNGNPGLFNSVFGATGVQFNPNNPLSGFSGFGPSGAAQQANFAVRNNLLGGALSNPAQAPVAAAVPAPAAQPQFQIPTVFGAPPAAQTPFQVPSAFGNTPQTRIQQNASIQRAISQATGLSPNQNGFDRTVRASTQRSEPLEPVEFPTFDSKEALAAELFLTHSSKP